MNKRIFVVLLIISLAGSAWAQLDYNKQFFNGKQLFREGKYNLAMETFKPLMAYDSKNAFAEYGSFYYALSAYKQGYSAVSKDAFNQLKKLYPSWNKMDEVNYWLAVIHFDQKEFFQGFKMLSLITDKKIEGESAGLKYQVVQTIIDIETLKKLHTEYPADEHIARAYGLVLAKNLSVVENRYELEKIIGRFHFNKTDFIPEAPKSIHKEEYTVSVVMPFLMSTLEASTIKKKNQIVLDFYEGMRMAADTLRKQGIKISLRAYDTERNVEVMKKLLTTDELKSSDLLVGPIFQEENKPLQDFSFQNKINVFNPFSNNSELIGVNPYAFLFQPSVETQGKKAGEFLVNYPKRKNNCIVYYGSSRRDSLLAANFIEVVKKNGIKVLVADKVDKYSSGRITSKLATPTEYDEFKYAKQFSLKRDSLGSIFVASDDPMIYSKVISAIETRGDTVMVLGSEAWLDQPAVPFEKYQSLPIILAAPNHADSHNEWYQAFVKKYAQTHGVAPSNHARIGYEFMLLAGNQLKENGVYFQEGLQKKGVFPGYLTIGNDYQQAHDNQFIPFIRFKDGKTKVIQLKNNSVKSPYKN